MQPRLVFGTASLHRVPTSRQRQRVLGAAFDAGIRAYDLAPAYGNGIDELEVGLAARGRRDELELNTKYGIPVPIYGGASRHVFPARRLADKLTGRSARAYRLRDFSPRELTRSLDGSLRRLRTDRVDGLFVHEPLSPLSTAEIEEILACGFRLKREGKIRTLGVAGPLSSLLQCPSLDGFDVVQTRCGDLDGSLSGLGDKPLILYGVQAAFREAGEPSLREFVRRLLSLREGTRVIVTSRHLDRIASFRGLTA